MNMTSDRWAAYADVFAFLGNSLLEPISMTEKSGLESGFWKTFPDFDDSEVRRDLERMSDFVSTLGSTADSDPVTDVSVEFTKLFIGPPRPAAAPWESMYLEGAENYGYGEATTQMRSELRAAGLQLENENNQYEDHIGIELLLLSFLSSQLAEGKSDDAEGLRRYLYKHPLSWIDDLQQAISAEAEGGYFDNLISIARSIARVLADDTSDRAEG